MVWGHPVMILKMFIGPNEYVDVGGRYWGTWPANSRNKDKMRIMSEGVELAIPKERIMDYEEYFKRFREGTLPENAAGKPWFLEGTYKGGIRE